MTEEKIQKQEVCKDCVGNVGNDGISDTGEAGVKVPTLATLPSLAQGTVRLNDYAEISIGGVVYRVKSVFSDKGQMGELLDLAVMEKLNRIA